MTLRVLFTPAQIDQAAKNAVRRGLEFILGESNQRVPLEYGDLQRSGRVEMDDYIEGAGRVVYDSVYAIPQHERLDYHHENGREAKYLENAYLDNQEALERLVGQEMAREIQL